MLAEITSAEWMWLVGIIAAVAVPSIAGWVTVYVRLGQIAVTLKHIDRGITDLEKSDDHQWRAISHIRGKVQTMARFGDRIADSLHIHRPE